MWRLIITQEIPREGYSLPESVAFESKSINKLLNIIESFSLVDQCGRTGFVIEKKEVNDDAETL